MMNPCPCDPTRALTECCGPRLDGSRPATSAEQLMRSRYSAYALGEVDYILRTILPSEREHHGEENIRQWSEESEWLGLEILEHQPGPGVDEAGVEFVARYKNPEGEAIVHHERSRFVRVEDEWFFQDGTPVENNTYVRESPKVGRNDPCPCGSGRKFKKCCAA